jgi:hypothetical protein
MLLVMVYLGAAPNTVIGYQSDLHYQIDSFGSEGEYEKK